jgi:hypothetical protein
VTATDGRNGWPRPCKFDESHGLFAGTRPLSEHYAALHPEHVPDPSKIAARRRVVCTQCGSEIARSSVRKHFAMTHPRVSIDITAMFREMPAPRRVPAVVSARPAPVPPPAPEPVVLPPLDADDIVLTVVDQLAEPSGLLPVAHLAAVFAWRDSTAAFIRAVQRKSPT